MNENLIRRLRDSAEEFRNIAEQLDFVADEIQFFGRAPDEFEIARSLDFLARDADASARFLRQTVLPVVKEEIHA